MEFIVQNDYATRSARLYIDIKKGHDTYVIGVEDGKLVEQLYDKMNINQNLKPIFEADQYFVKEFIQAVVNYAADNKIQPQKDSYLLGQLGATEKHLDDMRSVVTKLLDKITK